MQFLWRYFFFASGNKIIKSILSAPMNAILILVVFCAYFCNNLYFKNATTGIFRLFFVCYFNDLICPLLFFSYSNLLLLTVGRELKSLGQILFVGLLASFVWEIVAPAIKSYAVADFYDVIFYLCGSFLYYLIMKITRPWFNCKKQMEVKL